jgi:hypothetical protein
MNWCRILPQYLEAFCAFRCRSCLCVEATMFTDSYFWDGTANHFHELLGQAAQVKIWHDWCFFSTKLKRCYIATFGSDPILMTFLGVENRWTCLNCFFSQFSHCQLRFKQTVYIYIVDCFVSWLIIMFVHLTWTLLSCLRMLKSHFPS